VFEIVVRSSSHPVIAQVERFLEKRAGLRVAKPVEQDGRAKLDVGILVPAGGLQKLRHGDFRRRPAEQARRLQTDSKVEVTESANRSPDLVWRLGQRGGARRDPEHKRPKQPGNHRSGPDHIAVGRLLEDHLHVATLVARRIHRVLARVARVAVVVVAGTNRLVQPAQA